MNKHEVGKKYFTGKGFLLYLPTDSVKALDTGISYLFAHLFKIQSYRNTFH